MTRPTPAPASVRLDPLARDRLTRLQHEMVREGYFNRHTDIVSALVYYATAPSTVGICMSFIRTRAAAERNRTAASS